MISAPSLQRLLSGNSMVWMTSIAAFFMISCAGSKSVIDDPNIVSPNVVKDEAPKVSTIEVDTVRWSFVDESDIIPISSDMAAEVLPFEQINKEEYNVALLLPLRLSGDGNSDLNINNEKFAHFYAGYKLALQDIDWIQTTTYHTNRSEQGVQNAIYKLDRDTDLIIGPFDRENISSVAKYAKEYRVATISPWTVSTTVTADNLFYLQLRPNLSSYWTEIIKDATKNFDRSKIRLISNADGSDRAMMRFIQQINEEKSGLPISEPIEEYTVSMDSLLNGESMVFESAFDDEVEAFILPHYNTSKHDRFVYECLRKINAEKEGNAPHIYVMPLVVNSDRLDLNILNNLNVKICDYRFYDKRSLDYQRFKSDYYEQYGRLPNDDAYYGYDVGQLAILGFKKYGKYFHYYMKDELIRLGQMSLEVGPYYNSSDELLYLMNEHLDIYQFDGGYYQLKNTD